MSNARVTELFVAHGAFVLRVLRRLGVPARDVEDLAQDVFVIAHRKIGDFDGASPRGWLFRISTRVAYNFRRRAGAQRERLDVEPTAESAPPSQDADLWRGEMRALLDVALDRLSDAQREAFLLHDLEGLPMSEIATILECPVQTGYSRVKSARKAMRAALLELSPVLASPELAKAAP